MNIRLSILICSALTLFVTMAYPDSKSRTLASTARRAEVVEDKRVKKQMWAQPEMNSMMNKSFPIGKWDKHFSSVGSKRSPIMLTDDKEKQMFDTKTLDREEVSFEMSRWNEHMKDLHQKAGITLDDRAQLVADKQLYNMMLQDTQKFSEMGDQVSLRDINRYQFRRNRSDDGVPVEKAGSGK
ncbi:hypothetical protein ACWPKS_01765 [Coraliomargarita sp. W4R72]